MFVFVFPVDFFTIEVWRTAAAAAASAALPVALWAKNYGNEEIACGVIGRIGIYISGAVDLYTNLGAERINQFCNPRNYTKALLEDVLGKWRLAMLFGFLNTFGCL